MLFGGDSGGWIDPFLGDTWFYGYNSLLAEEHAEGERVSLARAKIEDFELVDPADNAFLLCTDDDMGTLPCARRLASKVTATHV